MKKIILPFVCLLFVLSSCKNNNDDVQFAAVMESLNRSNNTIVRDNMAIYDVLEQKLRDPQTLVKAEIWEPKAVEAKRVSADLCKYIDNIIAEIKSKQTSNNNAAELVFEEQPKAVQLYQKLVEYRKDLPAVINTEAFIDNPYLQRDLIIFKKKIDSSLAVDSVMFAKYFQHTRDAGVLTILSKIKNDVLIAENSMITYFNHMAVNNFDGYRRYLPLVYQNSKHFKTDDTLEIKAGIGSFSDAALPTVFVNEQLIKMNDGVATYAYRVHDKPGKYNIPVRIEYFKPDGTKCIVSKKLTYTVAQ